MSQANSQLEISLLSPMSAPADPPVRPFQPSSSPGLPEFELHCARASLPLPRDTGRAAGVTSHGEPHLRRRGTHNRPVIIEYKRALNEVRPAYLSSLSNPLAHVKSTASSPAASDGHCSPACSQGRRSS